MIVDHIDRKRRNNQKENLRYVTYAQNNANRGLASNNRSGYKGVSFHKASGKWAVRFEMNGEVIHSSLHTTALAAARCYDIYATANNPYATTNKSLGLLP